MPRRGRKADRPGHGHGPAAATSRGSVATALAGLGLMGGLAATSSLPCLALLLYLSRTVEVAPGEAQRMPWEDGHRRLLAAASAGLAALGLGLGLACGALAAALSLLAAALHGPGCEGVRARRFLKDAGFARCLALTCFSLSLFSCLAALAVYCFLAFEPIIAMVCAGGLGCGALAAAVGLIQGLLAAQRAPPDLTLGNPHLIASPQSPPHPGWSERAGYLPPSYECSAAPPGSWDTFPCADGPSGAGHGGKSHTGNGSSFERPTRARQRSTSDGGLSRGPSRESRPHRTREPPPGAHDPRLWMSVTQEVKAMTTSSSGQQQQQQTSQRRRETEANNTTLV
uniref:transmembrane protein 221-like n=1 Tax=Myxine glutinosa TaxID=7769 RepID=UPI00358E9A69